MEYIDSEPIDQDRLKRLAAKLDLIARIAKAASAAAPYIATDELDEWLTIVRADDPSLVADDHYGDVLGIIMTGLAALAELLDRLDEKEDVDVGSTVYGAITAAIKEDADVQ